MFTDTQSLSLGNKFDFTCSFLVKKVIKNHYKKKTLANLGSYYNKVVIKKMLDWI